MSAGVRLRQMLADLPVYRAGQRPAERPGVVTYKLSSNENPAGAPEAALAALPEAAIHLYPDPGSTALVGALAAQLGVGDDRVCVGCGSVSLCQNAVQIAADPGDEVVYAWRSFEAYPIITSISAARSVQVPLTFDAGHDVQAMVAAVTDRTRVMFLCTPNNPTGPVVTHEQAKWVLDSVAADVLVVIDEAYHEYVRDARAVRALELAVAYPNVLVLRTFSKAYGLAGLRVGYGIGSEEVIGAMRKVATPFGVSTVAQAAALACLQPAGVEHMQRSVADSVTQRGRLVAGLRTAGWDVADSQANFVWLSTSDAVGIASRLEEQGLTVRPFPGEGLRISVGPASANDRVLELLAGRPR
ncbi:MAG: histidinol-phosphate transaminase [Candidatus Nanopelagicales bacterium]